MMTTKNDAAPDQSSLRGAVLLPEIGSKAHLRMTISGLEALQAAYGDDYLQYCFDRLDTMTVSVLKAVASHCVQDCTVDDLLSQLQIADASDRLSDALCMSVYGRTVADELERRLAAKAALLKKAKEAVDG